MSRSNYTVVLAYGNEDLPIYCSSVRAKDDIDAANIIAIKAEQVGYKLNNLLDVLVFWGRHEDLCVPINKIKGR